MSQTLPFDWSRRTRVDWTTSESLSDIQDRLRDPLGYNLDDGQLRGIGTILNGTDLLFLRATGGGKSALIYGPLMMEPGIVAIIASPTDLLESDQVSPGPIYTCIPTYSNVRSGAWRQRE